MDDNLMRQDEVLVDGLSMNSEMPVSSDQVNALSPEAALQKLQENPVLFIEEMIEKSAGQHLDLMREQLELQSALHFAKRYLPDFQRFEPFILQELAQMIQDDEDGVLEPWPDLLEQAMERFRERFLKLIKEDPDRVNTLLSPESEGIEPVHKERAHNRKVNKAKPSYTRKQIESMSLEDFLTHEATINQALKDQRIK